MDKCKRLLDKDLGLNGLPYLILEMDLLNQVAKKIENDQSATFLQSCHFRGIEFIQQHHIDNPEEEISVILAALGRLLEYKPIETVKRQSTLFEGIINDEKNYLRDLRSNLTRLDAQYPNNPIRLGCKHLIKNHYEFYKQLKDIQTIEELPLVFKNLLDPKTRNIYANYKHYLHVEREILKEFLILFEKPNTRFKVYATTFEKLYADTNDKQFLTMSKELLQFQDKLQKMKKKPTITREKYISMDAEEANTNTKQDGVENDHYTVPSIEALIPQFGDFCAQGSVWEVLNGNLIKERNLYLYKRALVIAKLKNDGTTNFEMRSVLPINDFKIKADRDIKRATLKLKDKMIEIISIFNKNPDKGIDVALKDSDPQQLMKNTCLFLHKTPCLDKAAISEYLCQQSATFINHYMLWFDSALTGLRIDLALRLLLSQLYLPTEPDKMRLLLTAFAKSYVSFNSQVFKSPDTVLSLFNAFLQFDSELDWTFTRFSKHFSISKDKKSIIQEIFTDLQENALFAVGQEQKLHFDISHVPEYLIVDEIQQVSITVPEADPNVKILVCGQDLVISPSVLHFESKNTCKFTILPQKSGRKKIFFILYGQSAGYYNKIAPQSINVERDFMKHTFLLKGSILNKESKFLFAVATKTQKTHWINNLMSIGMKFK